MLSVILYNIRSVHNVGSIFRTADGAGFGKVYLCGITPDPEDRFGRMRPDFRKVALGAERHLERESRKSAAALIKKLKKEGWTIFALEQSPAAKDIFHFESAVPEKTALILGEEVKGLPPSILKMADLILQIPMRGKKESLNVSVAFGIAAYALAEKSRRR